MYIHIYIDIYMIRIARLAFSNKKKIGMQHSPPSSNTKPLHLAAL